MIALGVVVVAGAVVVIYLTLIKSDQVCYSDSGAEIGCDDDGALTKAEYDEQQAEEAEAAKKAAEAAEERAEAERLAAECEGHLGDLLDEARELDARLNVGMDFQEYSDRVGDVSVAYQEIPFKEMGTRCTIDAGIPLENAMNSYIKAQSTWNDCIGKFRCDTDSIDPELQKHWGDAGSDVASSERALTQLAEP